LWKFCNTSPLLEQIILSSFSSSRLVIVQAKSAPIAQILLSSPFIIHHHPSSSIASEGVREAIRLSPGCCSPSFVFRLEYIVQRISSLEPTPRHSARDRTHLQVDLPLSYWLPYQPPVVLQFWINLQHISLRLPYKSTSRLRIVDGTWPEFWPDIWTQCYSFSCHLQNEYCCLCVQSGFS